MATNENLPPSVIKQLAKELKSLDDSPPEGIKIVVNDGDLSIIHADVEGPAGTPYENGMFRMRLVLSRDFPQSPPKGYFLTKIFHPNISVDGEICVNTLKRDWNPNLGLRHVLTVVRCLLIEPFPESALNEQAGKMLLEDYEEYARYARLYTGIHAQKLKPKPMTAVISESKTVTNVDQSKQIAAGKLPASPAPQPGLSEQDQNTVPLSDNIVGASTAKATASSTIVKKGVVSAAAKAQTERKKVMDARKKSLKRL